MFIYEQKNSQVSIGLTMFRCKESSPVNSPKCLRRSPVITLESLKRNLKGTGNRKRQASRRSARRLSWTVSHNQIVIATMVTQIQLLRLIPMPSAAEEKKLVSAQSKSMQWLSNNQWKSLNMAQLKRKKKKTRESSSRNYWKMAAWTKLLEQR